MLTVFTDVLVSKGEKSKRNMEAGFSCRFAQSGKGVLSGTTFSARRRVAVYARWSFRSQQRRTLMDCLLF